MAFAVSPSATLGCVVALEPSLCPLLVCLRAGGAGGGSRVVSLWHPLDEGTVRVVDFVLPAAVECWSGVWDTRLGPQNPLGPLGLSQAELWEGAAALGLSVGSC